MSEYVTRRAVLATLVAGATTALAGCSGDDTDRNGETDDESAPSTGELTFSHPATVRHDEAFDITVEGVPPDSTVEVVLEGEDGDGTPFEGRAVVETSGETLSLAEAAVVDGSDDQSTGVVPADVDVPIPVALLQFAAPVPLQNYRTVGEDSVLGYRVEADGELLDGTTVTRTHPDHPAKLNHPELVGYVYEPVASGSGPGVLVLHGSGGVPSVRTAALLASHGFTTLALQYFGGEGLSPRLAEIPVEYVDTAAEWLLDHATVTGEQVGVYGISKGGELGLLAGSQFGRIGPVVSVVGSGIVWEGIDQRVSWSGTSSWSLGDDPLPYVPMPVGGETYTEMLETVNPERREAATIPLEAADGPVLLVSGGDDQLWPSRELHEIAVNRLTGHDHPDIEHLVYEDAGHYIVPPYSPMLGATREGGTRVGAAAASHDFWPRAIETLSTLR